MSIRKLLLFLGQRLAKMVLVVLGVVVVNFLLIHAAPGDPASVWPASPAPPIRNTSNSCAMNSASISRCRRSSGSTCRDARRSRHSHRQQSRSQPDPERLPATFLLTGTAFVFALIAGISLGAAAARRAGTWADSAITVLALGFYATPIFWVGLMLVLVFSVWLDWLPSFGMNTVGADLHGWAAVADTAQYLVLPALTLGLFYMAVYARLTRGVDARSGRQDFVKTARAKGVPEGRILRRHILRNALLPVVTLAGIQAGQLIGGSVLVETVFAWPGIGRLAYDALLARDTNLLLGVFLTTRLPGAGVQPDHRPGLSAAIDPAHAGADEAGLRRPSSAIAAP